jgi:hypothetical protein
VHHSRDRKLTGISATEVRARHLAQLSPDELATLAGLRRSANGQRMESRSVDEPQAVAYAVAHVFERKSVAAEHELLEAALAHGHGQVELPKLKAVLRQSPELVTACDRAGYVLRFCAPTAAAAEVLRKEGFDASTLEAFLRENGRPLSPKFIVVLDEAGAVGVDDMMRLLRLGARVILCGDTGQHGSVKRGDALRLVEEHSPYTFGRLTQVRRQHRADYRRVVELAAKKQTAAAYAELDRLGGITELSRDSVHATAAAAYISATAERKSALLIAPTWAEIEAVTAQVRAELKTRGRLGSGDHVFRVFDSLSWTEAQKRDARQYRVGQLLRFHEAKGVFARNEAVEIVGVTGHSLRVRRGDDSERLFSLERVSKLGRGFASFDVGEGKTLPVVPGDKLLRQANRARQFINGELVEVRSVQGGSIVLTDDRVIPKASPITNSINLPASSLRTSTLRASASKRTTVGPTLSPPVIISTACSRPTTKPTLHPNGSCSVSPPAKSGSSAPVWSASRTDWPQDTCAASKPSNPVTPVRSRPARSLLPSPSIESTRYEFLRQRTGQRSYPRRRAQIRWQTRADRQPRGTSHSVGWHDARH